MEIETDYIKTIKKLKKKIHFLEFIIILFIVAVIVGTVSAYYYAKPYIQKFNGLIVTFQDMQPAINQLSQLSQSTQLIQFAASNRELRSALDSFNSLSGDIKKIQDTTNTLKNNLQGFTNLFK